MASVAWSRLIRFIPAEGSSSTPIFGEPVSPNNDYSDIGALADSGKLEAKVIETDASGPLSDSAKVTDKVVKVGKLLGPLDFNTCTDIKCIGLNYKKHSECIRGSECSGRRVDLQSRKVAGRHHPYLSSSSSPSLPLPTTTTWFPFPKSLRKERRTTRLSLSPSLAGTPRMSRKRKLWTTWLGTLSVTM